MYGLGEPAVGDRVWWRGYLWVIRRRLRMGRIQLIRSGITAVALREQLTWDATDESWLLWQDCYDSEYDHD